jgi:hypothetical protein
LIESCKGSATLHTRSFAMAASASSILSDDELLAVDIQLFGSSARGKEVVGIAAFAERHSCAAMLGLLARTSEWQVPARDFAETFSHLARHEASKGVFSGVAQLEAFLFESALLSSQPKAVTVLSCVEETSPVLAMRVESMGTAESLFRGVAELVGHEDVEVGSGAMRALASLLSACADLSKTKTDGREFLAGVVAQVVPVVFGGMTLPDRAAKRPREIAALELSSTRNTRLVEALVRSCGSDAGLLEHLEDAALAPVFRALEPAVIDADPLSAIVIVEMLPQLVSISQGFDLLVRRGVLDMLAELAGWPVELVAAASSSASSAVSSSSLPAPRGGGKGLVVNPPHPFLGQAASAALTLCVQRASRLRFVDSEDAFLLVHKAGMAHGALIAAMAAMDGLGEAREGEIALMAQNACTALAFDEKALHSCLDLVEGVRTAGSPRERAVKRAFDTVIAEGFEASSAEVRRAVRQGIAAIIRAASVPPEGGAGGDSAVCRMRWGLGVSDAQGAMIPPLAEARARTAHSKALSATDGGPTEGERLWGRLGSAHAAGELRKALASAVWEDRDAALGVCEALAGQPSGWGLRVLRSAPGLLEALLQRDGGDERGGMDVRLAVVEAANRCPEMEEAVGPTFARRIKAVLGLGPAVPAALPEAAVATLPAI